MLKTVEERFWEKVDKSGGCWEWTASRMPHSHGRIGGYGAFCLNGKRQYAHRVCWGLVNGEIADGMCVLHKCDNPHV